VPGRQTESFKPSRNVSSSAHHSNLTFAINTSGKTKTKQAKIENICREWNYAPEEDLQVHDLSPSSASASSIAATPVPAPSSPVPA